MHDSTSPDFIYVPSLLITTNSTTNHTLTEYLFANYL
jgi:hypothetical protein